MPTVMPAGFSESFFLVSHTINNRESYLPAVLRAARRSLRTSCQGSAEGTDPSPQNKSSSRRPLTGAPVGGAAAMRRAKSALTGAYGEADAGVLGAELKMAVSTPSSLSKADRPVYLFIRDGQAELRDAVASGPETLDAGSIRRQLAIGRQGAQIDRRETWSASLHRQRSRCLRRQDGLVPSWLEEPEAIAAWAQKKGWPTGCGGGPGR